MNTEEVYRGIRRWNERRRDLPFLKHLLIGIEGFDFSVGGKLRVMENIHVYPTLTDRDELKVYLISAKYDKEGVDLGLYIEKAEVVLNGNHDNLPGAVARKRIDNWGSDASLNAWLDSAVETNTVFQAFQVPGADLASPGRVEAFFALVASDENVVTYKPDIILLYGANTFLDTVMPVPPFGINGAPDKKTFYILEQALSNVHKTRH